MTHGMRRAVLLLLLVVVGAVGRPTTVRAEGAARRSVWTQGLEALGRPLTLSADRGVTVRFGGEVRHRLELRDDLTFNDVAYEDDAVNLFRVRLQGDLRAGSWGRLFAQVQDAESIAGSGVNRTTGFVNRWDLHQLFAELHRPLEGVPLAVRIGRQELSYGDQRFVGAFGWSNVARVFDAATLMYTPADWARIDAWFSQVVLTNRVGPDAADHGDNFYGLYTRLTPLARHTVDLFLFMRHTRDNELVGERAGVRGQVKEYTLGNRFAGRWRQLDYGLEWAWQFGSRAHEDIRAWAWHQRAGWTFEATPWSPRVGLEVNHGSGDDDPRDGTVKNFDNLFPTNHAHYGYLDLAGLRNLTHLELNLSATPHPTLRVVVKHHWLFLDSNKSAWYNAGQGVIRPATPGASQTIGQETDVTATLKASDHLQWLIGYSQFHPGPFVRDSGADDAAHFVYMQSVLTF